MFASGFQLAQSRPANTNTATAYTAVMRTEVLGVWICNTTGTAAAASVYHDDDGTTYDESTALLFAKSVAANDYIFVPFGAAGTGIAVSAGGSLGVKSGTTSALTFTFYGVTESRAVR